MKGSQLNVILKYRRPADCWLCSDCESENNLLLGTCAVCGAKKDAGAMVIPAWSERDERPIVPITENKKTTYKPVHSVHPVSPTSVSRLGGTAVGRPVADISTTRTIGTAGKAPVSYDDKKYVSTESGSTGVAITVTLSIVLALVVLGIIIAVANS